MPSHVTVLILTLFCLPWETLPGAFALDNIAPRIIHLLHHGRVATQGGVVYYTLHFKHPFSYFRSTIGWTQRRLPSMDTEDFETIPSSVEESSNSSEEEGNNKTGNSNHFRVQLTYESRKLRDLSLERGDLVQFLEDAENGH